MYNTYNKVHIKFIFTDFELCNLNLYQSYSIRSPPCIQLFKIRATVTLDYFLFLIQSRLPPRIPVGFIHKL